jgi:hypothetical protein
MAGLTFGEMVEEVLWRVGPGSASDSRMRTRIKRQLNASHRVICAIQQWPWLLARTTITFTSTDTYLTLPTNCRNVVLVTLGDTGQTLPHQPYAIEMIQRGDLAVQGRGYPIAWAVMPNEDNTGQALVLIPLPGLDSSAEVIYRRLCTTMTQDADEPLVPEGYRQVIIEDTVSKLAAQDSFDPNIAARAYAARQELVRALKHTSAKAAQPYQTLRWAGHGAWRPG